MLKTIINHPFIQFLNTLFNDHNYEIRLVGGCVRDHFSNSIVKNISDIDIDIVANAPIDKIYDILKNAPIHINKMAIKYGILMLIDHKTKLKVDIASLRVDENQKGRHATTHFTNNWHDDAMRRDFTINALYCDMNKNIFDPYNGLQDIKDQRLKFIGNPKKRIEEDFLRILRYFRFIAFFKTPKFDADDILMMQNQAAHLKNLSKERITSEFIKLISYPNATLSLQLLTSHNIWKHIDLKKKLKPFYFSFPKEIEIDEAFIFSLLDDYDSLKKAFIVSKKVRQKIQCLQSFQTIEDAYFNFGKDGAFQVAWLLYINGKENDLKGSFEKIKMLYKTHPKPVFPINAVDIMDTFHFKNEEIGQNLLIIKRWWINNLFAPSKRDCLDKLNEILSRS